MKFLTTNNFHHAGDRVAQPSKEVRALRLQIMPKLVPGECQKRVLCPHVDKHGVRRLAGRHRAHLQLTPALNEEEALVES